MSMFMVIQDFVIVRAKREREKSKYCPVSVGSGEPGDMTSGGCGVSSARPRSVIFFNLSLPAPSLPFTCTPVPTPHPCPLYYTCGDLELSHQSPGHHHKHTPLGRFHCVSVNIIQTQPVAIVLTF